MCNLLGEVYMGKLAVYPDCRFCADKTDKYIVRVSRTSGEIIDEVFLPHLFACLVVGNDFNSSTQCDAVAIKRIGKPCFGIEIEIRHFFRAFSGDYPYLIASCRVNLIQGYGTRKAVGIDAMRYG